MTELWKDVFGREVQAGDYILSGAKTGILKLGTAYYSERGNLMMRVDHQFSYGATDKFSAETSAVGVNVLLLEKHNGTSLSYR